MTQLEEAVLNKFRDFRVAFEALCDSRYGTIPTASTSTKGGIIVGGGLSMVGDTLTVTMQGGTDNDADIAELDGKIATLNDSITALDVNLNTALAKIDQLDSGTSFDDTSDIDELKSDIVLIESRLDDFAYQLDNVTANVESSGGDYSLPTASTVTKGGVVIGGGLSMVGDTLTVTLQGGSGGLSSAVVERVNEMFAPEPLFQERYATSPFDSAHIVGLDLSHFVDGSNFEYETLESGKVRIRSGETSYNVNNGISRGYVEVKTLCGCTLTVLYSISSQASYDYGGCIITEDAPNTEFTLADLKSSTVNKFFYKAGKYLNQTATYRLEGDTTYYLNFGYAKNASTNSYDDRFYIHEIRIEPDLSAVDKADYAYNFVTGDSRVFNGNTTIAAGGQISLASAASLRGNFKVAGNPTFSGGATFGGSVRFKDTTSFDGGISFNNGAAFTGNTAFYNTVSFSGKVWLPYQSVTSYNGGGGQYYIWIDTSQAKPRIGIRKDEYNYFFTPNASVAVATE